MDRLSQGEMVAAISGLFLLLSLFLPWVGVETVSVSEDLGVIAEPVEETSTNLWDGSTLDIYLFLTAVLAIAPAALKLAGVDEDIPVGPAALLLGAVGTLLVLAFLTVDFPDGGSRKLGAFIGLLAVAGVTVGSWMRMQEQVGDRGY